MYKPVEKLMMDGRGKKESGWWRGSDMVGGVRISQLYAHLRYWNAKASGANLQVK